ncbi:MAG: TIM barrel protein [Clostridia bacterium]|nr:TIM barrel protein [Clostridia bacterium]
MKIAVFADAHVSSYENTSQLAALRYAVRRIREERPDAAVSLGDATAFGTKEAALLFRKETAELPCPKLFLPGNSDLRAGAGEVRELVSEGRILDVGGWRLIGLDTSEGRLREEDKRLLEGDPGRSVVFLHHAPSEVCGGRDKKRLDRFPAVVYGHVHYGKREENEIAVRALDPDKAIGGPPSLLWLEAGEDGIRTEYEPCMDFAPEEIAEYAGISCFDTGAILWAAENAVPSIEIRPGSVDWDREPLREALDAWRKSGGRYLSLHLPDFGSGCDPAVMDRAVSFAGEIGTDGVTFHVPRIPVAEYEAWKDRLADSVAGWIRALPEGCAAGIENLHMTTQEKDDGARRFGYTPSECLAFSDEVNARFGRERAGLVLDVGHARYNASLASVYPIGDWYAAVGKRIRAYHLHQVILLENGMHNHFPVDSVYGPLISYCGFSWCWNHGILAKRPAFLEIRGDYRTSYAVFTGRDVTGRSE